MYVISYQSGMNALSVVILIILIAFVNQELCHVLSDEAKSVCATFCIYRRNCHEDFKQWNSIIAVNR